MRQPTTLVGGENPLDIARAFPYFTCTEKPSGEYRFHASIPPGDGDPFIRSLMRIEAELLLEDADSIGTDDPQTREPGERLHDALALLMERMATAAGVRTGGT